MVLNMVTNGRETGRKVVEVLLMKTLKKGLRITVTRTQEGVTGIEAWFSGRIKTFNNASIEFTRIGKSLPFNFM